MFRKKKKKETAEELKAKLKDLEGEQEEDLDVLPEPPEEEALPEPPKKEEEAKTKAWLKKNKEAAEKKEEKPEGKFSLNEGEMALAVNALAASEEFKVYQQMVIGQQIAEIITSYNKAVGEKQSEVPSSEDTEEQLPE